MVGRLPAKTNCIMFGEVKLSIHNRYGKRRTHSMKHKKNRRRHAIKEARVCSTMNSSDSNSLWERREAGASEKESVCFSSILIYTTFSLIKLESSGKLSSRVPAMSKDSCGDYTLRRRMKLLGHWVFARGSKQCLAIRHTILLKLLKRWLNQRWRSFSQPVDKHFYRVDGITRVDQ